MADEITYIDPLDTTDLDSSSNTTTSTATSEYEYINSATYLPIKTHTSIREGKVTSEYADRNWLRRVFGYQDKHGTSTTKSWFETALNSKTPADIIRPRYGKAYLSYVDTSLGGNFPINTQYRYTRHADINMDRKWDTPNDNGMGRYYQESIEDHAHDIHLRFGMQKFNSGLTFFTNWFDYYSFHLGRFGRAPSFLFNVGQLAGVAMGFMAPQVLLLGGFIKLFSLLGGSRFWYVSPAMPLYWTAVTNIFNEITGAMALTLPSAPIDAIDMQQNEYNSSGSSTSNISAKGKVERGYINELSKIVPGVYSTAMGSTDEGFSIDVRRIATRCQGLENQLNAKMLHYIKTAGKDALTASTLEDKYTEIMDETKKGGYGETSSYTSSDSNIKNSNSLRNYMYEYLESGLGKNTTNETHAGKSLEDILQEKADNGTLDDDSVTKLFGVSKTGNSNIADPTVYENEMDDNSILNLFRKELSDGSAWLTIRVDGTGSVGESFSNSSEESQISSMINGWAQSRKQLSFNFAGGNMLGGAVSSIIGGITDVIQGGLDSIGLSGLGGFMMGANVDIPKTHSSSSSSLTSTSYKMKLRTPYGHPLCIAQDLYLPLACILAAVLPISAGRNSYTTPFYCELYDRGRAVVKNGLISSVQIERATSNVAWTPEGLPLGLDISFTVENLDHTVHMPINTSTLSDLLNPLKVLERLFMGNETALGDYITALAGVSLVDQVYMSKNVNRNLYAYKRQWDSYWDRDHFIQRLANTAPANFVRLFVPGTDRR